MRDHRIHKITALSVGSTLSKMPVPSVDLACGDYIWATASKYWKHVTCKKCKAIRAIEKARAKLDRKQGKLFNG